MTVNKESILVDIDARTQAIKDAIGQEISDRYGFRFLVEGLNVTAKSDRFGITVEDWQSKDGPQWQIFQSWATEWEPNCIRLCTLRTVSKINRYESSEAKLREIVSEMAAKVSAYLELHPRPKPLGLFGRMQQWIS
jgi:hypothetical protein